VWYLESETWVDSCDPAQNEIRIWVVTPGGKFMSANTYIVNEFTDQVGLDAIWDSIKTAVTGVMDDLGLTYPASYT